MFRKKGEGINPFKVWGLGENSCTNSGCCLVSLQSTGKINSLGVWKYGSLFVEPFLRFHVTFCLRPEYANSNCSNNRSRVPKPPKLQPRNYHMIPQGYLLVVKGLVLPSSSHCLRRAWHFWLCNPMDT